MNTFKALYLLLFLQFLFFLNVIAQGKFEIIGITNKKLDGAEITFKNISAWKYIPYYSNAQFSIIKNGRFYLSGKIRNKFEYYILTIRKKGIENNYSFFISNRKMKLIITSLTESKTINSIKYINVPFIDENEKYLSFIKEVETTNRDILKKNTALFRDVNDKSNKDSLLLLIHNAKKNIANKKIDFFITNPTSFISFYYFVTSFVNYPKVILPVDTLLKIYSLFSPDLQHSELGKLTYEYILKKKSLSIDNILPSFSFFDTSFREHNLSQFRNTKYVLLCFWASWCGPCIKNIPLLKEIYVKYPSDQLEIISVSIDTDIESWLNSVKEYKMPWLQTCDVKKYSPKQKIQRILDIDAVPQYFLIDKTGLLIYQSMQVSESDNYSILKDILNQRFGIIN